MAVSAAFILGILGNITGVSLFISPAIVKKKTTDNFSPTPYGMPFVTKNAVLVMTINVIGALLEFCYLVLYMTYAPRTKKVRTAEIGAAFGIFYLLVVLVVCFALHSLKNRHSVVGILCVIITIVMYAAPLSVLCLVIKTKSVGYMPLSLSIMVLLNSAAWSAYAVLTKDIYIKIPNVFGVVLGLVQLILYCCYCKTDEADNEEMDVGSKGLSEV